MFVNGFNACLKDTLQPPNISLGDSPSGHKYSGTCECEKEKGDRIRVCTRLTQTAHSVNKTTAAHREAIKSEKARVCIRENGRDMCTTSKKTWPCHSRMFLRNLICVPHFVPHTLEK